MYKHLLTHPTPNSPILQASCSYDYFFSYTISPADKCNLAIVGCSDDYDFVNFYRIAYCYLGGNYMITIPLSLLLIILIFRFISSVVEEYLAPAITYISEWLDLSEALAAVTLLALANGAGDVITAFVASGSSGGLSYNIGAIYGAGLFVCSIVVAMTINSSPNDIQLEPNSIWRDVGFYIIATLTVVIFAIIGELTIVSAIIMLLEYVLLVFIVWYQGTQKDPENEQEKEKEEKDQENAETNLKRSQVDKTQRLADKDLISFIDDKTEEEKKAESKKWKGTLSKMNTVSGAKRIQLLTKQFKAIIYMAIKHRLKQQEKEATFDSLSFIEKILFLTDVPFVYLRKITLPPCEAEKYDKFWAVVFPAPGLLFMVFACFLQPQLWWLGAVAVGLVISLAIHFTAPEKELPKYYVLLELFGAVGALMWTYIISGTLIDLLNYLGMVSKLNTTYLGLTVIAVGNALPDAVTTIALSKQGYAMMGLTGAYAGQLFGLLIGFGLSLLKKTYQEGPQKFNLLEPQDIEENLMNIIVIMVSLLNLVITFIYGLSTKYKFKRSLAKIIGTLYVSFIVGCTILAVYKVYKT